MDTLLGAAPLSLGREALDVNFGSEVTVRIDFGDGDSYVDVGPGAPPDDLHRAYAYFSGLGLEVIDPAYADPEFTEEGRARSYLVPIEIEEEQILLQ